MVVWLAAFAIACALFLLGGEDSQAGHIGAGLFFGLMALFVIVLAIGLMASTAMRLRLIGSGRAVWITGVGVILMFLGVVVVMLTGVLAAVGFAGATLHDSGPGTDQLVRGGLAMVAVGLAALAVRPLVNWTAGRSTMTDRQQWLARQLFGTRSGRVVTGLTRR